MLILIGARKEETTLYRKWILEEMPATITGFSSYGEMQETLAAAPVDLLIIDGRSADLEVEGVLANIQALRPDLPVIVIPDDSGAEDAISAFRLGASDYLIPPVDRQTLIDTVWRYVDQSRPATPKAGLSRPRRAPDATGEVLPEEILFGGAAKTRALKQVVDKIIDTDLPILITGESGTGKEMVARYISHHSARSGPFIKVNCAAIPSELLESELFGFEKGAFTGAYRRKEGKFEAANGGHLFLDEISELSYPLQSKLLHVLQDGTFSALGSTREVNVDVRIIAATNHQLDDLVDKGLFRDDLYFRLNVVHLHIPPLRERLDQLGQLVDYFRERFAEQYNRPAVNFGLETQSLLFSYNWPGNIRELENVIRRATILGKDHFTDNDDGDHFWTRINAINGDGREAAPQTVPETEDDEPKRAPHPNGSMSLKEIAKKAALEAEREVIRKVLEQTRWNRKKTAKILDVSYKTLLTKIKETGLDNG